MYDDIKQLIFPSRCIVCQTLLGDKDTGCLCDKCYSFVFRHHLCPRCGRPYFAGGSHCIHCEHEAISENIQITALFPYESMFRKAVLRWKYKGIRKYARGYADLFVNDLCLFEKFDIDGLIPVPLAQSRLRRRGFNQALDLTNELSRLTDIKVYDILERTKKTKPQSKCNKRERRTNIKGSIAVKKEISNLTLNNIAIIDDIYTTGATIKECIEAIKRHKIIKNKKIYVLTVCIGV